MIRGIRHNFGYLPPSMRQRVAGWDDALQAGFREIGARVERGATKRLSGGGQPGAYPVPRRSGRLARGMGSQVEPRTVVVFNDQNHAAAIHDGFQAYGNPHAPFYPGRPFLADAAAEIDPMQILLKNLERVL